MLTIALLLMSATCFAQEDTIFRTGVALVHADAEVTAPDGRTLTGFNKDDFRVFDEGKEQPIVNFAAEQQALDMILLFDVSGSMRAVVESVAASARQAFRELRPGDRVAVMVFNSRSRLVAPFTEDLDAIDRAIRDDVLGGTFGGGTLIQSAVDAAALRFLHEKRSQRRRAVLIITDNIGQRTRREESVVRDFWEADALLSGLIVPNPGAQAIRTVATIMGPQNLLMQAGMKGIAQKTGGDAIRANDPAQAFQDAIHRIRSRYGLYYALPKSKPGTTRSIRVELAAEAARRFPKSHVRARTGYVVPAPAAAVSDPAADRF
ncbi:MAG TPA: VWA domain-containing protein [Bryobacteraceae bacterium]